MQTATIIPINNNQHVRIGNYQHTSQSVTETIMPGKIVEITPDVQMGIAYDQTDGEYTIRLKFWYMGQRVKDYQFDHNNQLDFRLTLKKMITLVATSHQPSGRPYMSVIEIANVPFSWDQ